MKSRLLGAFSAYATALVLALSTNIAMAIDIVSGSSLVRTNSVPGGYESNEGSCRCLNNPY